MKDFEKAVNDGISQLIHDGTVNNIIKEKLTKTVSSIIDDCLSSYSDFGKALKEKISKELKVDLNNISFSECNKTILNLVEGILNNHITEQVEGKLKNQMVKLFGQPPEKINFSKLVEMFIEESYDETDREGSEEIALIIEKENYGYVTVGLHPSTTYGYSNKVIDSWHNCDLHLNFKIINEEKKEAILSFTYDRTGLKPHQFMPTCLHGTSRLLYQMYCAGSVITFDGGFEVDNYDVSYGKDY